MYELVGQLWERHHPAVVLVTHDVDEAILLADRILVLAHGSIGLDLTVNVDKPRDRADPAFAPLRIRLLAELGVVPNQTQPPTELIQNAVVSNWRHHHEI